MRNENIFWVEGLTSPSARIISDKIIEKLEHEIEEKIWKIKYANFPDKNIKRLKMAIGIEGYAKRAIQKFPINTNKYPILIGCSMGGLIARYLIEKMNLKVKGLILLATPNKGINLSFMEKFFVKIIGPIPCVEDMRPESAFLKSLGESPFEKFYYFFGGKNDSRVNVNSSLPIKSCRSIQINTGHTDMITAQMITKLADTIKTLILASNQSL